MSGLQEERSAETRRKLLDATLECLHEFGYAGTTTIEIARRAGVSRGAQLHHYPRKQELVASALEHVFTLRLEQFRNAAVELPASREARVNALIDLLWPAFRGPAFYAWLELVVASRTDAALRDAVRAASRRFEEGVRRILAAIFGVSEDARGAAGAIEFVVFGLLESLAIEHSLRDAEGADRAEFEAAIGFLKNLANFIVDRSVGPVCNMPGEAGR